jgi:hypothetical protein
MTEFFSSLTEPLRLLELTSIGSNSYQATYTYRAGKHVCAGSATVTVAQRNDGAYIEKIAALQGC